MDRFYSAVRAVSRFWLSFFFKHVDVVRRDRVPPGGLRVSALPGAPPARSRARGVAAYREAHHAARSEERIRFTPALVICSHALAREPLVSMPRQASSMTVAASPTLRASSADQQTQKSVARPTR